MNIRIVTEPSVNLVGRQVVDAKAVAEFLESEGVVGWETDAETGGEKLIEVAGRLCYMSFTRPRPGGNAAYIGHLLEVGHGSVLEHCVFNLIISGVSRSFSHELVRHRAGFGFSQLSQRYVDESDVAFVVPPALAGEVESARHLTARFGDPPPKACDVLDWGHRHLGVEGIHQLTPEEGAGLRWLAAAEQAQRDYLYLSDYLSTTLGHTEDRTARRKAAREAARSVLPNCTETKIFVTLNARAARHFIEMRADPAADAEMRRVALAVYDAVRPAAPAIFGDYTVDRDNHCAVTAHRKV